MAREAVLDEPFGVGDVSAELLGAVPVENETLLDCLWPGRIRACAEEERCAAAEHVVGKMGMVI